MKDKKVAIIQSNYVPWKGYFDIINMADEFIIYDDVQYTKNDWRNRNRIKTHQGVQWLTIPVRQEGLSRKIKDVQVADSGWNRKHWKTILENYSHAAFFQDYKEYFEELYLGSEDHFLSDINRKFIEAVCRLMGIGTRISLSADYQLSGGKTERLICLLKQAGAGEYVSGPAAKEYLDEELFRKEHIKLTWMDYSGYPEYHQLHPPFEHAVSILDLIFNEGPDAGKYMKSFSGPKIY